LVLVEGEGDVVGGAVDVVVADMDEEEDIAAEVVEGDAVEGVVVVEEEDLPMDRGKRMDTEMETEMMMR